MLREVIDDALSRGEKLKKDIVGQILKSSTFSELINNRRFTQTVARVIQTKDEISRTIQKSVQDALKLMSIPSKSQLHAYEKRVMHLEKQIADIGRRVMKTSLQTGAVKTKPSRRVKTQA
ncbi:MAG: phasin family protein [Deltaproteobacteria bacterium]|nr:MAG: phasin family protein [Deltaproteobacteria bacterium]